MATVAQLLPHAGIPAEYAGLCCVASCTYCKCFKIPYKFALDDCCALFRFATTLANKDDFFLHAGSLYSHQQTLCPKPMLAQIYCPEIQEKGKLHKHNLATLLLAQRSPNPEMALLASIKFGNVANGKTE